MTFLHVGYSNINDLNDSEDFRKTLNGTPSNEDREQDRDLPVHLKSAYAVASPEIGCKILCCITEALLINVRYFSLQRLFYRSLALLY